MFLCLAIFSSDCTYDSRIFDLYNNVKLFAIASLVLA